MPKITKDNTIMAAILTESGAPFNEAGVDCVKDMIVEKHPELAGRPIIAMMGNTVNTPIKVRSLLAQNPNTFVIVSYDGGAELEMFEPKDEKGTEPLLKVLWAVAIQKSEATAWEVFAGKVSDDDVIL